MLTPKCIVNKFYLDIDNGQGMDKAFMKLALPEASSQHYSSKIVIALLNSTMYSTGKDKTETLINNR